MATNELCLSGQSKRNDSEFGLIKIAKYWILKTHNTTKRLTFLDNVKDVVTDENILIADDQLYEIRNDENGDFSFWKVEDLSHDSGYRSKKTESRQPISRQVKTECDDNTINESLPIIQEMSADKLYPVSIYDEIKEDVCTRKDARSDVNSKMNIFTEHSRQIIRLETTKDSATYTGDIKSDMYQGSTEYIGCGIEQGHNEYDSLGHRNTVEYSVIETANITSKLSSASEVHSKVHKFDHTDPSGLAPAEKENSKQAVRPSMRDPRTEIRDLVQEFEVEVEPSGLAKPCGIEGKMILVVRNNDISFEDPITKRVKYSFQLSWIRDFANRESRFLRLTVGRKCPNGSGSVNCVTPYAKIIKALASQKCREKANQRKTDCKRKPSESS